MAFANGNRSPFFEGRALHHLHSQRKVIKIERTEDIGFVSMKICGGLFYHGIRMHSRQSKLILEEAWADECDGGESEWTPMQSIPRT